MYINTSSSFSDYNNAFFPVEIHESTLYATPRSYMDTSKWIKFSKIREDQYRSIKDGILTFWKWHSEPGVLDQLSFYYMNSPNRSLPFHKASLQFISFRLTITLCSHFGGLRIKGNILNIQQHPLLALLIERDSTGVIDKNYV